MQHFIQILLFATLGILFLQGIIYARDLRPVRLRYSLLLLIFCGACYLIASDKTLLLQTGWLKFLIAAGAIVVPAAFWLVVRALFVDEPGIPRWFFFAAAALLIVGGYNALAGAFFGRPQLDTGFAQVLPLSRPAQQLVNLVLIAHALFVTYWGHSNDLLGLRREFRLHLIGVSGAVLVVFAVTELVLDPGDIVGFHRSASVFAVLALSILFGIFALRADGSESMFSVLQEPQAANEGTPPPDMSPADLRILEKLRIAFEEERLYREHGLTIAQLADRLDVPEHRLRRVINQSMGFRNFAAFLSSYRLTDVVGSLSDRDKSDLPITTIAFDAGFQSLATFNRSFRRSFGVTPSAFREKALRSDQNI